MDDFIINKEIKENNLKGEKIRTHCNKCEKEINHIILMNYSESGEEILNSDFDPFKGRIDYTADFINDYQIIRCSGCDTISYRSSIFFSAIQDIDCDGFREERYPTLIRRIKKEFKYLPSILIQIYNEVIKSCNNDGFILCAAGIRAALEGICKDKDITGDNLKEKIENMREQGLLSLQHENIMNELRFLGNYALHELQKPTKEEVNAALDIIEHIFESLYEIEGKASILNQKTAKNRP